FRVALVFFFFFQAEDGIRDPLVTGVQTCALPISLNLSLSEPAGSGSLRRLVGRTITRGKALPERMPLGLDQPEGTISGGGQRVRSEERRVGKECRERGRTWYEKKKRVDIADQEVV